MLTMEDLGYLIYMDEQERKKANEIGGSCEDDESSQ